MGTKVASPSYTTVSLASERVMVAVCGIEFAIKPSCACGVSGTEASTVALGLFTGIFGKVRRHVSCADEGPWTLRATVP